MAPNGAAVAAWLEDRSTSTTTLYSVHARAYSPATGWGPAVAFGLTGDGADDPDIAINANGDAILVWVQPGTPSAGTSRGFNIGSARLRAGVWDSTPTFLLGTNDIPTANFSSAITAHKVTLDNAGNAFYAFTADTILNAPDGAWVKQYRNGAWGAAVRFLPGASSGARDLTLAAAADGATATAVWRQFDNDAGKYRVLASEYSAASGWSAGHVIDGNLALGTYQYPRVAIAANGDTTAVWEANTTGGTRTDIYAARFAGGSWGQPVVVGASALGRADSLIADLCSDASGNAVLVTLPFDLGQVAATRYTVGTGWSSPVRVPPDSQAFIVPQASVACNTKGDAMVSWRAALGVDNSYQLWARPYTPAGGWGASAQIISLPSNPGLTLTGPRVGLDDAGQALTIWRQDNQVGAGLNTPQSLWSATFK